MPDDTRNDTATKKTFSQKWGDDPFTSMGYTQVPNALIQYAAQLELRSEECWLICCILKFKFDKNNPTPRQEDLARLFGQSIDTVQRTVKKIMDKNLLRVERVRSDFGRFTHMVYDFTPLRYALNECYYADHPQDRPRVSIKATEPTPQICGVVEQTSHTADLRHGNENKPHRRSAARSTPQICGVAINKVSRADSKNLLFKETDSSRTRARPDVSQSELSAAAELIELLIAQDVNRADAQRLALEKKEECRIQLEYLPYVTEFRSGKGAYLRSAIESGYGAPKGYRDAQLRAQKEQKRSRIQQSHLQAMQQTRTEIESARSQAQADPVFWDQIMAEAVARLPRILRERPNNPAYEPALQTCIDSILKERTKLESTS